MCNPPYMSMQLSTGEVCVNAGKVWTPTGDVPLSEYILNSSPTPGTGAGNKPQQGGAVLDTILSNAGGILSGIGDLFSSIKGTKNGDTIVYQSAPAPTTAATNTPIWVWAVVGVIGLIGIFAVVQSKRKKVA